MCTADSGATKNIVLNIVKLKTTAACGRLWLVLDKHKLTQRNVFNLRRKIRVLSVLLSRNYYFIIDKIYSVVRDVQPPEWAMLLSS